VGMQYSNPLYDDAQQPGANTGEQGYSSGLAVTDSKPHNDPNRTESYIDITSTAESPYLDVHPNDDEYIPKESVDGYLDVNPNPNLLDDDDDDDDFDDLDDDFGDDLSVDNNENGYVDVSPTPNGGDHDGSDYRETTIDKVTGHTYEVPDIANNEPLYDEPTDVIDPVYDDPAYDSIHTSFKRDNKTGTYNVNVSDDTEA